MQVRALPTRVLQWGLAVRGTGRWSGSGLPQPSPVRLWMFSAPHTVRWSFLWPQRCAAGLVCPANPQAAILRVCGLEVGGSGAPADPAGTCRASRIAFFSPWLLPFFFPPATCNIRRNENYTASGLAIFSLAAVPKIPWTGGAKRRSLQERMCSSNRCFCAQASRLAELSLARACGAVGEPSATL